MLSNIKKIIRFILFYPFLKKFKEIGSNVEFGPNVKISFPEVISIGSRVSFGQRTLLYPIPRYHNYKYSPSIKIGNDVYIGGYCQIHSANNVQIKDGCVLSDYVYISDVAHGLSPKLGPIMLQELHSKGSVIIGESTFLGFGVCVMPGVEIGKHCVVGTRSVVTKSCPDYSMLAGSPAKIIRKFDLACGEWVPVND
ncbi:acyltransferase [Undibacterium sp. Ji67W]|uniref:acyltransferase n=1 Tax=Undibacterium sp. Ji67W TaxID=3413042 RepID=UPI003BF11969